LLLSRARRRRRRTRTRTTRTTTRRRKRRSLRALIQVQEVAPHLLPSSIGGHRLLYDVSCHVVPACRALGLIPYAPPHLLLRSLGCGPGIWGSVEITRSGPYIADRYARFTFLHQATGCCSGVEYYAAPRVQQSADFLTDGTDAVFISKKQLQGACRTELHFFCIFLMRSISVVPRLPQRQLPFI